MVDNTYEGLADALSRLPNGFTRTTSGIELLILKRIFSSEEAQLAGSLSIKREPVADIARRLGLREEDLEPRLVAMAQRGLLWSDRREGKRRFRLAPFMVGIYEAQLESLDHEFAHLVEDYFDQGGLIDIMKPQPAIHRVIPAQKAVKSEWILPYDDVKAVLMNSKAFHVVDCICRKQQDLLDRKCTFPIHVCLSFSSNERPQRPGDITREEALALLDKTEETGLVHTVSNVMTGYGYVCNCCGCCCGVLRGITEYGIENSVAHANYYATIDPDTCIGCGVCEKRCQVKAITMQKGTATINQEQCIGCGLCATGCPTGAAQLKPKPRERIIPPPLDYETWEQERLHNRGP